MRIILTILFLLTLSFGANAAPIKVLMIEGPITQEHESAVRKNRETLKYLVLNTKGGDMQFAYNIMTIISYYNVTTVIPPGGTCESACTIIFQAGKQRYAGKDSTLIYHAARFDRKFMRSFLRECPDGNHAGCQLIWNQMEKDLVKETLKMFRTLEHFGLNHEVFIQFINAPHVTGRAWLLNGNLLRMDDLKYTAEEAKLHNAVTDIVEWDVNAISE